MNSKARAVGFQFVKSSPLGMTILVRRCLEPFRRLVASLLHMGSASWEDEQRANSCAQAEPESAGKGRRYRVLVSATQDLEQRFFAEVVALQSNEQCLQLLPFAQRTARFARLTFRMLSRMGCCVEQLLALPHSQYPFRLFLLLEDPDLAEVFLAELEGGQCAFDEFSLAFCQLFQEAGLGCADALAILRALAALLKVEITDIESKHAALRRFLKAAPQAATMSSKALSAVWSCKRWSKRQARCFGPGLRKVVVKHKASKAGNKVRRHKRSAWQAFVAEKSQGRRADFSALHASFTQLPREELAKYQAMAAHTTRRPRGQSSAAKPFGHSLHAVKQRLAHRRTMALAKQRLSALTEQERLHRISALALTTGSDFGDVVSVANAEERAERAIAREAAAAVADRLAKFREERRAEVDARLRPIVGDAAPHGCVHASPAWGGCGFRLRARFRVHCGERVAGGSGAPIFFSGEGVGFGLGHQNRDSRWCQGGPTSRPDSRGKEVEGVLTLWRVLVQRRGALVARLREQAH